MSVLKYAHHFHHHDHHNVVLKKKSFFLIRDSQENFQFRNLMVIERFFEPLAVNTKTNAKMSLQIMAFYHFRNVFKYSNYSVFKPTFCLNSHFQFCIFFYLVYFDYLIFLVFLFLLMAECENYIVQAVSNFQEYDCNGKLHNGCL